MGIIAHYMGIIAHNTGIIASLQLKGMVRIGGTTGWSVSPLCPATSWSRSSWKLC